VEYCRTWQDTASRTDIPRKEFCAALDFTNTVGGLAEEEGHHPAILTEYGKVTVVWWTHKIKGLHRNDFIMAAKTDQIAIEPTDL